MNIFFKVEQGWTNFRFNLQMCNSKYWQIIKTQQHLEMSKSPRVLNRTDRTVERKRRKPDLISQESTMPNWWNINQLWYHNGIGILFFQPSHYNYWNGLVLINIPNIKLPMTKHTSQYHIERVFDLQWYDISHSNNNKEVYMNTPILKHEEAKNWLWKAVGKHLNLFKQKEDNIHNIKILRYTQVSMKLEKRPCL